MKRDKLEIVNKVLDVIFNYRNITPTNLLFKANLSPQMFRSYKKELIDKGFIEEAVLPKGAELRKGKSKIERKTFILTEKGREYLEFYPKIIHFKEKYGLAER